MRHVFVVLSVIALAACETLPAYSQTSTAAPATASPSNFAPPADQQLLELERQLSATAQEQGLGGALATVMDPSEGISIRPGVTYSAVDVAQGLAPPANAGPMYWQPDRVHVSSSGDMGVTSGRYVQVVTGTEAIQGRYLVVWRRDSGGDWKALTETRIPDPPRAAPRRR
ncbi:MAG: DUF4440 domain-containing protein [Alphaproteobacteria bacterium]